jgi:hypothetical protein
MDIYFGRANTHQTTVWERHAVGKRSEKFLEAVRKAFPPERLLLLAANELAGVTGAQKAASLAGSLVDWYLQRPAVKEVRQGGWVWADGGLGWGPTSTLLEGQLALAGVLRRQWSWAIR